MGNTQSIRQKILADIRLALRDVDQLAVASPVVESSLVFRKQDEGLADGFVRAFMGIDGRVVRCENAVQLTAKLKALLERRNWKKVAIRSLLLEEFGAQADVWRPHTDGTDNIEHIEVGITDCEYLVSSTGSIVMSAAQSAGRTLPVYVPVHIVVARESQLVQDLYEATRKMEQRYEHDYPSAWYFMSGPSRTGDIEKTLVLGVHGPIEVYVFLMK